MGLLDRFIKARTPDYAAVFGAVLDDDDVYVGSAMGFPHAYERKGRGGDAESRLLHGIVDGVTNRVSRSRNIEGDEDSIARRIPLDGDLTFVVVSRKALSLWSLGMTGTDEPELVMSIPREAVVRFSDTGKKAQGKAHVTSMEFADGSSFAYRILRIDDDYAQAMASFG